MNIYLFKKFKSVLINYYWITRPHTVVVPASQSLCRSDLSGLSAACSIRQGRAGQKII